MNRDSVTLWFSDRGIPLVYQGPPPRQGDSLILTVENYCKWYSLYAVQEHGEVVAIHSEKIEWGDHIPNPESVIKFALVNEYDIDTRSLEMMIGRWHREALNEYADW
jgi:hypothetical protein